MSRSFLLIIGIIALLLPSPAPANPPADIDASYDEDTEVLSVEVTHPVEDPTDHFIEEIQVTVPGQAPLIQTFLNQAYASKQIGIWDLELDGSHSIRIEAVCNQHGTLQETFEVEGEDEDRDLYTLAQADSILIRDVPAAPREERDEQQDLWERVYWKDTQTAPAAEEFGYDHEAYGFRTGDEFGYERHGRFGYEVNAEMPQPNAF